MANANVLFNVSSVSTIGISNIVQANNFQKDGNLLYDPATSTLYLKNLSVSGYQKLPGGLIIQWGSVNSVPSSSTTTVTLPIAYPNAQLVAYVSLAGTPLIDYTGAVSFVMNQTQITVGSYVSGGASATYRYLSLGY